MKTRINYESLARWQAHEFRREVHYLVWHVSFSLRVAWLGYRLRHEF